MQNTGTKQAAPSRNFRARLSTWLSFLVMALCACRIAGADATPPLGATVQADGVTFRVWAPFVESVAVKVNGAPPVALAAEAGHPEPADATYAGTVPGAKAGDTYKYVIVVNGAAAEFNDPRARRLTGTDNKASSVIVDTTPNATTLAEPSFNTMVIYELHVGTFNPAQANGKFNFAGTIEKLDYLKDLGINAIELMPVHENAVDNADKVPKHIPPEFNWGYDAVQLYAIKGAYGSPEDFKELVRQCHQRGIAVILDVVYNHLVEDNLLKKFGGVSGPGFKDGIYFYGDARESTGFGPRPDYGRQQVRDYLDQNALMWLTEYGVDGLRWDSTINIRAFDDHHFPIKEGGQTLRDFNDAYRKTDPNGPGKISIAEDLQGDAAVTNATDKGGFGFNSQWEESLFFSLRRAVIAVNDEGRDLFAIRSSIEKKLGGDVFSRVIFSENHDKVGHPGDQADNRPQIRLPALIDVGNTASVFAKKRSTLAAAIVLTSPGVPMIFQGQEMLDPTTFDFYNAAMIDWQRTEKFKGIVQMYKDLIALRRNIAGKTGGLTLQNVNVFHTDPGNRTLAYHRFGNGGAGDDVVVVANFSNVPFKNLNIGFPRGGKWVVRFNSGAAVYDPEFKDGDSSDTVANPGGVDNLNFNANVGIGPYSVVILSQD